MRSFTDFEDPLLALETLSAAQLLVKKEAQDLAGLVKKEEEDLSSPSAAQVKVEEGESAAFEMTTPTKRRRVTASSTSSTSRSRKVIVKSEIKTVKREISSAAAAQMYPTPPETPNSNRSIDFDYFGESPISLVERVKRSRTGSRTSPRTRV